MWSLLLPHLGLTYLCSPKHNRAPDAYWAVASNVTKQRRQLIREGLRKGAFDQSCLTKGVSRESNLSRRLPMRRSIFQTDGVDHISLSSAAMSTIARLCPSRFGACRIFWQISNRCLRHFLKPPILATVISMLWRRASNPTLQRFALLAFLSPDTRQVASSEWKLHAFWLKHFANQIAELNGHDGIRDTLAALSQALHSRA